MSLANTGMAIALSIVIAMGSCGSVAAAAACRGEGAFKATGPEAPVGDVDSFIQQPGAILANRALTAKDTYHFTNQVAQYMSTDNTRIAGVVAALKSIVVRATQHQREAIGRGLFRAYAMCLKGNPAISAAAEVAVAMIGNKEVSTAFSISLDNMADASAAASPGALAPAAPVDASAALQGGDILDPFQAPVIQDPFATVDVPKVSSDK